MEVYGKRLEQALCEPCKMERLSKQADGFCTDCKEYMCQTCFLHHLKAKACRNHVLDPFNAGSSDIKLPKREERCKKHKSETIKYYCDTHDSVVCGDCLVLDHPKCEPKFIRDVAKNYEKSTEFKSLVVIMPHWEADKAECEARVKLNREHNKALINNALQELHNSRTTINDWLDKKEESIKTQIRSITDDNDESLLEIEKQINAVGDNIEKIKESMDTNLYHSEDLFIHMVECKERIPFIDATLSDIKTSNVIDAFTFEPDIKANEISKLSLKLGVIKFSNEMQPDDKETTEAKSDTTQDIPKPEITKMYPNKAVMQRLKDPSLVQLTQMEVATKKVKLLKKLRTASFGEVHAGRLNMKVNVAVNILNSEKMIEEEFLAEAKILHQLRHNKIVQLLAVCTLSKPTMIISEVMVNGNLLEYLREDGRNRLKLPQLTAIAGQIADGMAYLETTNCIHRDLRADSILVGNRNEVKVARFGLAQLTRGGVYLADESITGYETLKAVANGLRMSQPSPSDSPVPCPEPYYHIMLHCWNRIADDRPTFAYLKDFFENYNVLLTVIIIRLTLC